MKLTTTLVIGALTLAGCTTKNYYVEEPSATTRPPSTTKPKPTTTLPTFGQASESEYLKAVRRESEAAEIMFDEDILDAGWATCSAFDDGLSAMDVVGAMTQSMGEDPKFDEMLLAIASLSTVWLCPEYVDIWSR